MKSNQWLDIDYSSFCRNPEKYYLKIVSKLDSFGYEINHQYAGPDKFNESNEITLNDEEVSRIIDQYYEFHD